MHFLLSVNDWWLEIQKFFHEMNQTVKFLLISTFILLSLLSLIRFLKPKFQVDKNKYRVMPIVGFVIFLGLACLLIFI